MNLILVSYDLRKEGQNYDGLIKAIKSYVNWANPLKSVWLIKTPKTYLEVRDYLCNFLDANDGIITLDITNSPMSWNGIPLECDKWIKNK